MCQGGPGVPCAGVAVLASVMMSFPTPKVWILIQTVPMFLKGQWPVVMKKWKSQLGKWWRPCDRQQLLRGQIIGIWGDFCAERLFDEVSPEILVGSFRVAVKVALEEIMAGVSRRCEIQQVTLGNSCCCSRGCCCTALPEVDKLGRASWLKG